MRAQSAAFYRYCVETLDNDLNMFSQYFLTNGNVSHGCSP
ncbi:hypothetical protein PROSTU_01347 [Providencia stuartii ATCC 25827]|uniref:Uncharacterized protein n=1 Tax=Providencia stuartii ATCC 25827 TaxID=471874 RepID=A0AA87CUE3_PROST|nr:hypothetical protein PROSTU_01347 [Providencia stuartii ATCC 25827]